MKNAFTLIELLIVVAIIGILAAIAVPNFLNAQVRAKIANTEADERSLATALETYRLDNNIYPPTPDTAANMRYARLAKLTSPIPYMSTVPLDPFRSQIVYDRLDSAYPFGIQKRRTAASCQGIVLRIYPKSRTGLAVGCCMAPVRIKITNRIPEGAVRAQLSSLTQRMD